MIWHGIVKKFRYFDVFKILRRVEFRPLELQLTDEENALLAFLVLRIVQLIFKIDNKINFYIPMSYVILKM